MISDNINLISNSTLEKTLCFVSRIADLLSQEIHESDTVSFFEGNEYVFIKINEELYSTRYYPDNFPSDEKIDSVINAPIKYKAQINLAIIKELSDFISNNKSETKGVYFYAKSIKRTQETFYKVSCAGIYSIVLANGVSCRIR